LIRDFVSNTRSILTS